MRESRRTAPSVESSVFRIRDPIRPRPCVVLCGGVARPVLDRAGRIPTDTTRTKDRRSRMSRREIAGALLAAVLIGGVFTLLALEVLYR